jgi:glycosyltransferase involved in cell wall biosynthesis
VRIALDATYSIDPNPSGIAVYSRELPSGLAQAHREDQFLHCYRIKQYRNRKPSTEANVLDRLLLPPLPTFRSDVFHALNQRVDRRPARRVVSTFHDLFMMTNEYSTQDFRERFTEQARRAAANSDLIITVSQFTAKQVEALLHVPKERIRVVPHGVRVSIAPATTTREKLVLFVGALQVRKNVGRLVEAFEQMPADWRLVLAGGLGYGSSEILRQLRESRAADRIDVPGYVNNDDLESLYARASIFAFPSLDEGFGMPVLDAMARGVPVITSNTSALPEIAGDAAMLVNPYSATEISSALMGLANNAGLREKLASAGRKRAIAFTWEAAVKKTYSVYRELVG